MVNITFFEIHLDGAELTANAPFSSSSGEDEAETSMGGEDDADGPADDRGGLPVAPLVGLVVVVVLVLAAKKLLGGTEIEEIDVDTE